MTNATRRFCAPWERKLYIMTALFVTLCAGAALWFVVDALHRWAAAPGLAITNLVCAGLFVAGIAFGAVFAPRGYTVNAQAITVSRIVGPIVIPLSDITAVEIIPAGSPALRRVVKTIGVGGAFGYYGRFYGRQLGEFRAYVTRTGPAVLLRRASAPPVLLSPDDVEAFARAVRAVPPASATA